MRAVETLRRNNVFILLLIAMAQINLTKMQQMAEGIENSEFAQKLIQHLAKAQPQSNIILSPASIQICGAMVRVGARGDTAAELDRGLSLKFNGDIQAITNYFHNFLSSYSDKESPLSIANKIYVMTGYSIRKSFNDLITSKFLSAVEGINFADSGKAAGSMNSWIESKTNSKIKNLIAPEALSEDTRLVLLNAIYFKGEWKHKFQKHDTYEADFYLNDKDSVKVQMMSQKNRFKYADLTDQLDAKVLEMPYRKTDLSMLIILPNTRTGLKSLEEKLITMKLADISERLEEVQVNVKLPKFKDEFSVDLTQTFQEMGMSKMFSNAADLTGMLDSSEELRVSKIIHKAFIEVDESGTEAAAATGIMTDGIEIEEEVNAEFEVNRPFRYIIKSNDFNVKIFEGLHKIEIV